MVILLCNPLISVGVSSLYFFFPHFSFKITYKLLNRIYLFMQNASVHHRKAVLGFIAQLDVEELPLFFALLIKPLQIISQESDSTAHWFWTSPENSMDQFQAFNFLKYFTMDNIIALSWKKRYGFLHVIEDVLGVFDELHLIPFLDLLMGCVVRVLGSCASSIDVAKCNGFSSLEDHSSADMTLLEKDGAPTSHVLVLCLSCWVLNLEYD